MPAHLRITSPRSAYCVLFSLFLLLLLASCAQQPAALPSSTPPAASATHSQGPTAPPATPAHTTTPAPSATPGPTPLPAPVTCSPLAVQPIKTIREIITQPFAMPRVMQDGSYKDDAHHGLDMGYYTRAGKLFTGTPVQAALDGLIAAVIHDRPPYGNMLILESPHARIPAGLIASQQIPAGDSLYTLYAHLQNLQPLEIGQSLPCGAQLAETGLTGFTGGPHLHFETRWGPPGQTFPVMAYYKADASPEELANYARWRMSGEFHIFDPLALLAP